MKVDITKLGYRWKGAYDSNTTYIHNDVVLKEGASHVYKTNAFEKFVPMINAGDSKGELIVEGQTAFLVGNRGEHFFVTSDGTLRWNHPTARNGSRVLSLAEGILDNHSGRHGGNEMVFLMTDGTVRQIGRQYYGAGSGRTDDISRSNPIQIQLPHGIYATRAFSGFHSAWIIDQNGHLWGWGYRHYHGCGQGQVGKAPGLPSTHSGYTTQTDTFDVSRPQKMSGTGDLPDTCKVIDLKIAQGYGGNQHCVILTDEDTDNVYCWGYNLNGRLGLGGIGNGNDHDLDDSAVPVIGYNGLLTSNFGAITGDPFDRDNRSTGPSTQEYTYLPAKPYDPDYKGKKISKIFSGGGGDYWEGGATYAIDSDGVLYTCGSPYGSLWGSCQPKFKRYHPWGGFGSKGIPDNDNKVVHVDHYQGWRHSPADGDGGFAFACTLADGRAFFRAGYGTGNNPGSGPYHNNGGFGSSSIGGSLHNLSDIHITPRLTGVAQMKVKNASYFTAAALMTDGTIALAGYDGHSASGGRGTTSVFTYFTPPTGVKAIKLVMTGNAYQATQYALLDNGRFIAGGNLEGYGQAGHTFYSDQNFPFPNSLATNYTRDPTGDDYRVRYDLTSSNDADLPYAMVPRQLVNFAVREYNSHTSNWNNYQTIFGLDNYGDAWVWGMAHYNMNQDDDGDWKHAPHKMVF